MLRPSDTRGECAGPRPPRRPFAAPRPLVWLGAGLLVAVAAYATRTRPAAEIRPFARPGQEARAGRTVPLGIDGTDLAVAVPADWRPGGVVGPTVVVSLIGSADGYPAFSVQTDPAPDARLPARSAAARLALERLQTALDEGRAVDFSRWTAVNGIDTLSSRAHFVSPAGRITVRRLLLQRHGRPYIFTWTARSRDYAALETLVEACVRSLRRRVP